MCQAQKPPILFAPVAAPKGQVGTSNVLSRTQPAKRHGSACLHPSAALSMGCMTPWNSLSCCLTLFFPSRKIGSILQTVAGLGFSLLPRMQGNKRTGQPNETSISERGSGRTTKAETDQGTSLSGLVVLLLGGQTQLNKRCKAGWVFRAGAKGRATTHPVL